MFKEETERPDGGYLIPCLSALSPKPKTHPNVNRKPQKKTFCHIPVQTEKKTNVLAEGIYVFLEKQENKKRKTQTAAEYVSRERDRQTWNVRKKGRSWREARALWTRVRVGHLIRIEHAQDWMSQRREGREALSFVVPCHSFDALSARRHAPKEQRTQLEGLGSVYTDVPLGETECTREGGTAPPRPPK